MKIYLIFFLAWINSSGFHRKRGNLNDLRNDGVGGFKSPPLHYWFYQFCTGSPCLFKFNCVLPDVSYYYNLLIVIYVHKRHTIFRPPLSPLFLHTLSISCIPFPFLTYPFHFLHTLFISYIPFPFLTFPFHFLHTLSNSQIPFPFLIYILSLFYIPFPFLSYSFPFLHKLSISYIPFPFLTYPFPFIHTLKTSKF